MRIEMSLHSKAGLELHTRFKVFERTSRRVECLKVIEIFALFFQRWKRNWLLIKSLLVHFRNKCGSALIHRKISKFKIKEQEFFINLCVSTNYLSMVTRIKLTPLNILCGASPCRTLITNEDCASIN